MTAAKIASIFHPSDFSSASEIAFVHALKIALVTRARLHMLHVDREHDADWSDFPGVRTTLARWGLLPPDSPRRAVLKLGIDVEKVIASGSRPVSACLDFLATHPADLIVLAVRQLEGRTRWLESRVGEPIARKVGEMTLLLPYGVQGFVSREDGSVSLRNFLVPVAAQPSGEPAVAAVLRMIEALRLPSGVVKVLHVGRSGQAPSIHMPANALWSWEYIVTEGKPEEVIPDCADTMNADLIVMTTEGRQGFLDALRGSTSERVLSKSPCPVLCLPA